MIINNTHSTFRHCFLLISNTNQLIVIDYYRCYWFYWLSLINIVRNNNNEKCCACCFCEIVVEKIWNHHLKKSKIIYMMRVGKWLAEIDGISQTKTFRSLTFFYKMVVVRIFAWSLFTVLLGSITSRFSGNEPALLPRRFFWVDLTREIGGNRVYGITWKQRTF